MIRRTGIPRIDLRTQPSVAVQATTALLLTTAATLLSGCVATKYQSAPSEVPPAITLDLRPATASPLDLRLDAVVTRGGPGSWKRDALWSEYQIFAANRSSRTWQLERVSLIDTQGRTIVAGSDPWELERASSSWMREHAAETTQGITWGVGQAAAVGAAGVAGAGITILEMGGILHPEIALPVIGAMVGAAVVPKVLTAPARASAQARDDITNEFLRRRSALLVKLPPGRDTHGSAFFPIVPEASHLVLECRSGNSVATVTLDIPAPARATSTVTPSGSADPSDWRITPGIPVTP